MTQQLVHFFSPQYNNSIFTKEFLKLKCNLRKTKE